MIKQQGEINGSLCPRRPSYAGTGPCCGGQRASLEKEQSCEKPGTRQSTGRQDLPGLQVPVVPQSLPHSETKCVPLLGT